VLEVVKKKPKVHTANFGLPLFYAHKWFYEEGNLTASVNNCANKNDCSRRLIKKRTIPIGPSFMKDSPQKTP
jgi:hypothetical protein